MAKSSTSSTRSKASLNAVLKNLNSAISEVKTGTDKGVRTLAIKIERGSKLRVPREYGNLAASGYHRKSQDSAGYEVGFTADYAVYVHENLEMKLKGKKRPSGKGVYWGPKGEARFLSKAIEEQIPTAAATVAGEINLKGGKK
mgnify:CR=1 FL=1